MSTPSPLSPESPEVLLQLFWQRLGHTPSSGDPLSRQQRDAARRIVAAVGPSADAVTLAAAYADEFSQDLPHLADALGHPSAAIQALTPQALTGGALLAATAVGLGQSRQDAGDLAGAEHAYRWAVQQFHVQGEAYGQTESLALVLLGRVLEMQERLNESEQCYREALALDQAAGDEDNAAVDLGLLGIVAWLSGRLDEAEKLCQQALARQTQSKDWSNMATALLTLASVAEARGNTQEATGYRERASLAERRVNLKPGHVGNKYDPFPDLYGRFQAIQQLSDLVAVVGGGIVRALRWLGGRGGKPANAASPLTDPARARAAARRYVFRFGTVVGCAALVLGGLCVVVSLFVHDLSSSWLGITVAVILVCILVLVLLHPAFAAFIVASQTRFRDGVYAGLFAGVIVAAGGGGIFGMLDALRHPRSAMVVHLLVDVLLYVGVFVLIWLIPSLALALVGSLLGDKSR